MQKLLTAKDKSGIVWIQSINTDYMINTEGKKVYILEYLWIFEDSFFMNFLIEKWYDFTVKITKINNFSDTKKNYFYDSSTVIQLTSNPYFIYINDNKREKIPMRTLTSQEINYFIQEEKGTSYMYQHFISLILDKDIDIDFLIYELLFFVKQENFFLRKLEKNDIIKYLKHEISPGEKNHTYLSQNREKWIWNRILNKVNNFLNLLEKIYYESNIQDIDLEILELIETEMSKWDNFMLVGSSYKGWCIIKWIPIQDFHILKFLGYYMNIWDSITINLYSAESMKLIKEEKTWIDAVINYSDDTDIEENQLLYMSFLLHFSEENNIMLDQTINKFILNIGNDFYVQRIVTSMSRYFTARLWVGKNTLKLERGFQKERIEKNIIF